MADPRLPPAGVDIHRPNVARMYDYYLGGKNNFAADREAAEQILAIIPEARMSAQVNRRFLGQSVRYLTGHGIHQFLDIGSGIPTQGNVHEIALQETLEARVVYVDYDPIVLSHARALLHDTDNVTIIRADVRSPGDILGNDEVRKLIDFDRPIALMLVALLHFVQCDEEPYRLVREYRDALAPGSYLVLSHAYTDQKPQDAPAVSSIYSKSSSSLALRSKAEIEPFFEGFELIKPGLVDLVEYRPGEYVPNEGADWSHMLGAIARKL